MRQLLSGAARMHERGIVLVGGEGAVKICDLGLTSDWIAFFKKN